MRVSTGQVFYAGVRQMQNNQSAVSRTFEQISTGQRIQSPSDDPAAMARVMALQNDNQMIERYQGNISLLTNSLTEQETHLRNLGDAIGRLETITLRAGNGTLTETEHNSLSLETKEIFQQILDLSNTRNSRGEYLFAGSKTDEPPFGLVSADPQQTPDIMNGTLEYSGNSLERQIEISAGSFVTQRDNGGDIFMGVDATGDPTESGGILHTAQALTQILRGSYTPEAGEPTEFTEQLGMITDRLKSAASQVDTVRSETGARLNLLEATNELHEDTKLHNTSTLSELQDVDFYEALSDLQLQNTVLEAAQRSFAQVSRTSLFDYF